MRLSDIISRDIPLVKRGRDGLWTSPVHDSLIVDDRRGKWNWYSRGTWGDAKDWLVFWRNIPIAEARRIASDPLVAPAVHLHRKLDFDLVTRACANLHSPPAVKYLETRRISLEWADRFRLGYLPGKIVIPGYSRYGYLSSVRYRLMKDWVTPDGRIVRYYSMPGSRPWYPYGIWNLPASGHTLLIAEGEFKIITLRQMGYWSLGTQGMQFRPGWAPVLASWKRIIYLRDTRDLGGVVSANRIKKILPMAEIVRVPAPHKAIDDLWIADPEKARCFLADLVGERHGESPCNLS